VGGSRTQTSDGKGSEESEGWTKVQASSEKATRLLSEDAVDVPVGFCSRSSCDRQLHCGMYYYEHRITAETTASRFWVACYRP